MQLLWGFREAFVSKEETLKLQHEEREEDTQTPERGGHMVTGRQNKLGQWGLLLEEARSRKTSCITETCDTIMARISKIISYDPDGNLTQDGRWIYE